MNNIDPTGNFAIDLGKVGNALANKAMNYVISKVPGLNEAVSCFNLFSNASSFFGDLGEKFKNFLNSNGFKTNEQLTAELKIQEAAKGVTGKKEVVEAQSYLSVMGFPIGSSGPNNNGVDGQAGGKTESAVKSFQKMTGMEPTGIIDPETLNKMKSVAESGKNIRDLAITAHKKGVQFDISRNSSSADFVNAIYYYAIIDEAKTGVPAAVTVAQAALETGYGKYVPIDINTGQYSYNLFGVKGKGSAGQVSIYTHEYENGVRIKIIDQFRAYNNFGESITDRSTNVFSKPRYKSLFNSNDPKEWAKGLQKAGYATDPNYAKLLTGIMDYWGLK